MAVEQAAVVGLAAEDEVVADKEPMLLLSKIQQKRQLGLSPQWFQSSLESKFNNF